MTDVPGAVVVASYAFRHEADIAAGLLHAEGITAAVLADDGGGSYPGLGSTGAQVVVPAEEAERAREVLEPDD